MKKHSADPKEWGPVGFDKSNHLLSVMASSNNIDGVNSVPIIVYALAWGTRLAK